VEVGENSPCSSRPDLIFRPCRPQPQTGLWNPPSGELSATRIMSNVTGRWRIDDLKFWATAGFGGEGVEPTAEEDPARRQI
jgi:hypothetical protein